MPVTVRSFAKINLGLNIGPLRPDGFHDLRTVYQTIALHDVIRVQVGRGSGIEIRVNDPRVPKDSSNTCYRMAEPPWQPFGPVDGDHHDREASPGTGRHRCGVGNAVATLFGSTRLEEDVPAPRSCVSPLKLAGTCHRFSRGDGSRLRTRRRGLSASRLAAASLGRITPAIAVSTPQAFKDWTPS